MREVTEETGQPLGSLASDTGRWGDPMRAFYPAGFENAQVPADPGVELVECPLSDFSEYVRTPIFNHDYAVLMLAVMRSRYRVRTGIHAVAFASAGD